MMQRNQQQQRRSAARNQDGFDSKLIDLARVTRVAAGGRRFRFRAVVAVGDKKCRIGIGMGKGAGVAEAMEKATRKAKKNLMTIPLVKDTIPHEVQGKWGASQVLLKPKSQGRGLVAGGVVRILCELGGVQNISAKFIGKSKNKLNNAMATLMAMKKLKNPK